MRHNKDGTGAKPNPPNMRRKRYSQWLNKAATLLQSNGDSMTAGGLMHSLPDDRYTPSSNNSAAQKLMKDDRFGSFEDFTTDLNGHRYRTRFFFYDYKGDNGGVENEE